MKVYTIHGIANDVGGALQDTISGHAGGSVPKRIALVTWQH